jgi:DNA oxidative demethylase
MPDLFAIAGAAEPRDEMIAPGAVLLRGFALSFVDDVLAALGNIAAQAPFRHTWRLPGVRRCRSR